MSKAITVNAQQLEDLRNLLESIDALLYSVDHSLPELINAYELRYFNQEKLAPLNQRTIKYLPSLCVNNRQNIRDSLVHVRRLLRQALD